MKKSEYDRWLQFKGQRVTRYIGIAGKAGSGKDSVATAIKDDLSRLGLHVKTYAFATPLKMMLSAMMSVPYELLEGVTLQSRRWREEVIPAFGKSPREMMQLLGTEWGRDLIHPDLWVLVAETQIEKDGPDVAIFTDLRFPNELALIARHDGLCLETVLLGGKDGEAPGVKDHKSEKALDTFSIAYHHQVSAEWGQLPKLKADAIAIARSFLII